MDLTWGTDVSKWQGVIDWPQVERSGLADFAAVRVTIGVGVDVRWQANLAGAADHVPLPMAYAVVGTKAAQADAAELLVNMVDRVSDISRVVLVVDAENFSDGSHPTMGQVHQFRDALHRLTGRWPLAYLPGWFMSQHSYETDGQPWPWWPSRYRPEPWTPARLDATRPDLAYGFQVMGPWQFTSSGSIAGISGNVDRNVYFGSLAELRALTLGGEEQDMPLTEAEWDRMEKLVDQRIGLLFRGDAGTPTGGTHQDNLKNIRADLDELGNQIDAVAPVLTDAQLEVLAERLATKAAIVGHPTFTITGEATPKEPTP